MRTEPWQNKTELIRCKPRFLRKKALPNHFSLDRANQIVIRSPMIRFVTSRPSSRTVGQAPLRLRRLVPSFLLLLAIAGLTMQALQGERGWRGWNDLQTEKAFLQEELDALKNQNTELRQQVELLGNNNLDLDFLDERARLVLGLVGRDETIVFKTDPRLN